MSDIISAITKRKKAYCRRVKAFWCIWKNYSKCACLCLFHQLKDGMNVLRVISLGIRDYCMFYNISSFTMNTFILYLKMALERFLIHTETFSFTVQCTFGHFSSNAYPNILRRAVTFKVDEWNQAKEKKTFWHAKTLEVAIPVLTNLTRLKTRNQSWWNLVADYLQR